MPLSSASPLACLHSDRATRRARMRDEFQKALVVEELEQMFRDIGQGLEGPSGPSRKVLQQRAQEREDEWMSIDATDDLLQDIERRHAFALYLRVQAGQGSAGLLDRNDTNLTAAIAEEYAGIGLMPRRFPVYGLRTALDFDALSLYRPVWIPPQCRAQRREIVLAAAEAAALIVVNAMHAGEDVELELQEIPARFAARTWLLAGRDAATGHYVSPAVAGAADLLSPQGDHVAIVEMRDGAARFSRRQLPAWVRDVVGS